MKELEIGRAKPTNNEYVRDYFLKWMKKHGYTKEKFAEFLGVMPYNVYTSFPAEDSEKSPRNFSLDEIVTFCIKTGTSLDDILKLDERRNEGNKTPETFGGILATLFKLEDNPYCMTWVDAAPEHGDDDVAEIGFQFHLSKQGKVMFEAWQTLMQIETNAASFLKKAFRENALIVADFAINEDGYYWPTSEVDE